MFDDLLEGNAAYADEFPHADLPREPAKHLAVVTCMDARLDVFAMLGLDEGDVHVIRNAGARVTDDVLRSLIASTEALGVTRVVVIEHTDCGMAAATDDELKELVKERRGIDEVPIEFHTIDDAEQAVHDDVALLRSSPYLSDDLDIGGFVYDVQTGKLTPVD